MGNQQVLKAISKAVVTLFDPMYGSRYRARVGVITRHKNPIDKFLKFP